jgi:imidazolonepropionase-like amidohydrolase
MGLQNEAGAIEVGTLANLAFVSQNPLADVKAFKSVVLTVKRGRLFWRKDFRRVTPQETDGEE